MKRENTTKSGPRPEADPSPAAAPSSQAVTLPKKCPHCGYELSAAGSDTTKARKAEKTKPDRLQDLQKHFASYWRLYLLFFITWLAGSFFIFVRPVFTQKFQAEDVLRRGGLRTEFRFIYKDKNAIKALEEQMIHQTPSVFTLDDEAINSNYRNCVNWFGKYQELHANEENNPLILPLSAQIIADRLKEIAHDGILQDSVKYPNRELNRNTFVLYCLSPASPEEQAENTESREIRITKSFADLCTGEEAKDKLLSEARDLLKLSDEQFEELKSGLKDSFQPTVLFSQELSHEQWEKARQLADAQIPETVLEPGEPLIEVTQNFNKEIREQYYSQQREQILEQTLLTHLKNSCHSRRHLIAVALFALFCLCSGFALYNLPNRSTSPLRTLVFCSSILILYCAITYTASSLAYTHQKNPVLFLLVCLPIALPSGIVANLISRRHAIVIALLTSLTAPLLIDFGMYEYQLVHFSLFCTVISALLAHKAKYRKDFFKMAICLGSVILISCLLFQWEKQERPTLDAFMVILGFSYANGIIASIFCYLGIALYERVFSLASPITLMELHSFSHPLLKKMQEKAGGTFQHSVLVAQLAEQGAKEIGADADLAWGMGIFHDIGKTEHPEYFTENQTADDKSLFESLDIMEQVERIRQHPSHGENLGIAYHVKRPLRRAIREHHGDSIIGIYYQKVVGPYKKALAEFENKHRLDPVNYPAEAMPQPPNANPNDFRYHLERPKLREIAIIMLADSCEAAVRSEVAKDTNPDLKTAIRKKINEIFKGKIEDGQLDECEISMHEISILRDSFQSTFESLYHHRPQYSQKPASTDSQPVEPQPAPVEPQPAPAEPQSEPVEPQSEPVEPQSEPVNQTP